MDLYQVRYFLTIAETGSFSRAAERLYLSQPSLSTGIKKLEQELGVTLFERGGRRTVLTASGRLFLEKASIIMAQYQAALHELQGTHERPTLRVGVLITMRVAAIANLVRRFQQHYPSVTLELYDYSLKKLQESLEQGDLDIALTVLSEHDTPQTSKVLFQQPLLLAVPANHPWSQRASIRLSDLDQQPFIDRVNCEFFQRECQILKEANIHPKVLYRANHEEWVIALIQAGLGMSIMPHWKEVKDIVYLKIADLDLRRTLGLKWRAQKASEWVETFSHFAASHAWDA